MKTRTKTEDLTQRRRDAEKTLGQIIRALNAADRAIARIIKRAALLCGLCASVCIFSGCDSTDGDFHTPIAGMSIEKAYRIAGEAGYMRQETKLGGRWMHVVQLEQLGLGPKALMALDGAPLLDAQLKQQAIFESLGRTDQQMRRAYNAAGIAWAKVGDGAIATAVMSGIVAGVMALNDDGGGGSSKKTDQGGGQQGSGTTVIQVQNSPGATVNNDGGEGGQAGGGSSSSEAVK